MGDDPFIAGIYNYCDRWCERCAFTARCRLFADERRLQAELEDSVNEQRTAFWTALEEAANDVADSVEDADDASESWLELEAGDDEREARIEDEAERDPLVCLAEKYGSLVFRWLKSHEQDFPAERSLAQQGATAVGPAEALDVISWHHFQIGVKLHRATRGKLEAHEELLEEGVDEAWDTGSDWQDDDDGEDEIDLAEIHQDDADGSAKVALLGIERSLGAWTILRDAYPAEEAQIRDFQRMLGRLRQMLDATFPNARTFHRPGFDD